MPIKLERCCLSEDYNPRVNEKPSNFDRFMDYVLVFSALTFLAVSAYNFYKEPPVREPQKIERLERNVDFLLRN